VLLLVLGGGAWYLINRKGSPAGGPGFGGATVTVGHAAAREIELPVTIDALGTVTPLATITLKAQVGGVLTEVLFTEGQTVAKNQLLARIDPRPYEQALMQAQGTRVRDEAQLEAARVTLARYRTLLTQDSIARQDVDTQAALVKQLEGTVMTDRASEGVAKLNLSYTQVKAPITGRVGLRVVDMGNLVGSGDANGIAVITQLSPIDVEFSVPQDQVPDLQARIKEGAPLPAIALDRTRTTNLASGKFAALDNQVDVQTGTVKAKARFTNTDQALFPSQFVNLRLEVRNIKDAVVVPVTALRHGATGDFVYVLNAADRTVALRPVTRGQATVDKIEVKAGLQVGEQVITEGADRLKDGAKVTLPGDTPMGGGAGGGRRGNRGGAGRGAAAGAPATGEAPVASAPSSASAPAAASAPADAAASGPPAGERRRRRPEGATQ
jgi:multidrug efflux system membrane fusion protein